MDGMNSERFVEGELMDDITNIDFHISVAFNGSLSGMRKLF